MTHVMRIAVATGMLAAAQAMAQPGYRIKDVPVCTAPAPGTLNVTTASVVTLHFTDAPLRDVLAALCPQIAASITIEANDGMYTQVPSLDWVDSTKITVNIQKTTFWDAVQALVAAIPVVLDPQPQPGRLLLLEHPDASRGKGIGDAYGLMAMMRAPGAKRAGALWFAPMVETTGYEDEKAPLLLVKVAAEPRVAQSADLAVLRLAELRSADGVSLAGDKSEFVATPERGRDAWSRWVFRIGPATSAEVKAFRGELWLATGKEAEGTLDLTKMFKPVPPAPGEVQTNDECQIFRAPTFAEPRGTYVSKDRAFPDECKVVHAEHRVVGIDTSPIRGRHVEYTEERTLVMHNVTDSPEVFVVWTARPSEVRFTSEVKPEDVPGQGHGEIREQVGPGATKRLHLAWEVNQKREQEVEKRRWNEVNDVPPAPKALWQHVTVGQMRLDVMAVVPQHGEYVVRGQTSSVADGPVKYACPEQCLGGWPLDASGRTILALSARGPVTRVDGRDVMQWSLTTMGRGMTPAKFKWNVSGVTEWMKVVVR